MSENRPPKRDCRQLAIACHQHPPTTHGRGHGHAGSDKRKLVFAGSITHDCLYFLSQEARRVRKSESLHRHTPHSLAQHSAVREGKTKCVWMAKHKNIPFLFHFNPLEDDQNNQTTSTRKFNSNNSNFTSFSPPPSSGTKALAAATLLAALLSNKPLRKPSWTGFSHLRNTHTYRLVGRELSALESLRQEVKR